MDKQTEEKIQLLFDALKHGHEQTGLLLEGMAPIAKQMTLGHLGQLHASCLAMYLITRDMVVSLGLKPVGTEDFDNDEEGE